MIYITLTKDDHLSAIEDIISDLGKEIDRFESALDLHMGEGVWETIRQTKKDLKYYEKSLNTAEKIRCYLKGFGSIQLKVSKKTVWLVREIDEYMNLYS